VLVLLTPAYTSAQPGVNTADCRSVHRFSSSPLFMEDVVDGSPRRRSRSGVALLACAIRIIDKQRPCHGLLVAHRGVSAGFAHARSSSKSCVYYSGNVGCQRMSRQAGARPEARSSDKDVKSLVRKVSVKAMNSKFLPPPLVSRADHPSYLSYYTPAHCRFQE
jgi:hypothetical protein